MQGKKRARPTEEELITIIMHTSRIVWQKEMVRVNLESWLDNFNGEVFKKRKERFLALWLLSHFTYYNQNEVTHLCKVVYNELIHWIVTRNPNLAKNPNDLVNNFFGKTNVIPAERTSGSSGFIAYFFRHSNKLPMTLFNFSIENISDVVENILIIDDVALTEGERGQMHEFWEKNIPKYPAKKFFLITLISSESVITYLKDKYNVEVITAVKLDRRDKCFSEESDVFSQFSDLRQDCLKLAKHYGGRFNFIHPLGYEDGQYTFGFFYNTPDNTLPIFWGQVKGWKPIVQRYHKNYGYRNYLGNERFL